MEAIETYHILVTLGIAALVCEIFVAGTLICLSTGIGFFFAATSNYLGHETETQLFWFSLGIVLAYFSSTLIFKSKKEKEPDFNTVIGRDAIIVDKKLLTVSGETWRYQSKEQHKPGEAVTIKDVDGLTVII